MTLSEFQAWDSEGITLPDGTHKTILFGDGDNMLENVGGISGKELLEFLYIHADPSRKQVIFSGTYDVTMMLKDAPRDVLESLLAEKETMWDSWKIEYIPRKFLILSHAAFKRRIIVDDVFSLFGTSFVVAVEKTLGLDVPELPMLRKMKDSRSEFNPDYLPTIRHYMSVECALLCRVMEVTAKHLERTGYRPTRWYGPGAVASVALRKHKLKDHMSEDLFGHTLGAQSLIGGRFESRKVGTHIGPVYVYDLHSCYPWAMTQLPSLRNLQWRKTTEEPPPFGFHLVQYENSDRLSMHPVPYRSPDKGVSWPGRAYSLVATPEYELLRDRPHTWICAFTADNVDPHTKPFHWLTEIYEERARLKAAGDPAEKALKLVMNSIYGKLAQTIGCERIPSMNLWTIPKYCQPEWAAYILSIARAELFKAIELAGDSLIACETDSVITSRPLSLPLGTGLGSWGMEQYDGIMYLQTGFRALLRNGEWTVATRGVEYAGTPRGITAADMEKHLSEIRYPGEGGKLVIDRSRFIALTARRWDKIGCWLPAPAAYTAGNGVKRNHEECGQCGIPMSETMHDMAVPARLGSTETLSKPHSVPWLQAEHVVRGAWRYSRKTAQENYGRQQ